MGKGARLSEVLEGVKIIEKIGGADPVVNGIAYDSRKVKPGDVFVCIQGYRTDGHRYAGEALQRGAVALVFEKDLEVPLGIAGVKVKDSRTTLGLLAANFYGHPSHRLRLIGVTGTNGKTTTTHLIERIMQKAGLRAGLIGTIANRIGDRHLAAIHTTPESADLQELLALMVENGAKYAVMEVSSHALQLNRVAGCYFSGAVFTNLTQDHLDFHSDMQEYAKAKSLLFSSLYPAIGVLPYAIINADDPWGHFMHDHCRVPVWKYGIKTQSADFWAGEVSLSSQGTTFLAHGPWGQVEVHLQLPGWFNVYNALAAMAVGYLEQLDLGVTVAALESLPGVPGRFERVDCGQDFTVIVDYAHSPDSLKKALQTARQITSGQLICVFGCGGDRDRGKRPLMGEVAGKYADQVIVTSDNPRSENPIAIIDDILSGLARSGDTKVKVLKDRREAIHEALRGARSGDLVLIAGKGHETYQIIGDQVLPFDDREVVREFFGRGSQY
ncbi:MAG: UDP-N-acetylmuramoyl-L-alanyl-D-glutamate--2,6-diaminopimelate ligase [Clostridia bacterium]|nr:UDP-N-acetylmuramoyl-L-alanyl-D-glutamate--2,6-diaminopimelate ligase [Clostridia bacterium]